MKSPKLDPDLQQHGVGTKPVGPDQFDDEHRRRQLRQMKLVATGLFVLAAVVFIVAALAEKGRLTEAPVHWAGYVRATAEAAMVGALADWFAVTALFRHPLGMPIPHTAIIQKRKDQIGQSLGSFVRDNFLTREVVQERLGSAQIGRRVGDWLTNPDNAASTGEQSAALIRGVTEVLQDDVVATSVEQLVRDRAQELKVAPLMGRVVDAAVEGDHHQRLLESVLNALASFMADNRASFRKRLDEESPWWVPEPIDDRLFDKLYTAVQQFVSDVGAEPNHEMRIDVNKRAVVFAEQLRNSPELAAKAEALKAELLDHPDVRAWSASLWHTIKSALLEAAEDPESDLRQRLQESLVLAGKSIQNDPELQQKLDAWVLDATSYVAEQFRDEVAGLISTTVGRWDTQETAERLELQVGKDLQYIRINGTLVGGVAGLVIYSLSQAFL